MELNMPAPWRLAALLALVVALPLEAQHHERRNAADEFNEMGSRIDSTVALGRGGMVDLSSFSGDIKVSTWDRDEVKIHATSRGRLRLDSSPSRVSLVEDPYRGSEDDDDHSEYDVTMPRSARLLARSVSGDVNLRDVADVESHTVSGEIVVSNIANRAILETVSGDLTATKIGAGLRANSVSGDIHATAITGEVAGQSVSGDIVLEDVTSRCASPWGQNRAKLSEQVL